MVDVKKTANVAMTLSSNVDGQKEVQAQRGGNVSVPATVEVDVKTAHQSLRVTISITADGHVTTRETHVFPGLGKTRELPKVEDDE